MYRQSCPCRGRSLSASRDYDRYEREITSITLAIIALTAEQIDRRDPTLAVEIRRLDQDRRYIQRSRNNAFSRVLETSGPCPSCSGTGYRETPGTIGGYDRKPSTFPTAEKLG